MNLNNSQQDPFARFSQYEVKDEDPFSKFSEYEVKKNPKKRANVSPVGPKEEGWFEKFGRALSTQAQTNVPIDIKALTPAASGATFGLSEKIPGFEVPEEYQDEYGDVLKFAGSIAPIEALFSLSKPLVTLAQKSPIAAKQLSSLARIVQSGLVGASYEGINQAVQKGDLPNVDDVATHGAEWAALDALLQTFGSVGSRFGKLLLTKSQETGKNSFKIVNEVLNTMHDQGISLDPNERVAAKALSILEDIKPVEAKPIQISGITKKELSKSEKVALDAIKENDITPKSLEDKKVSKEFFDRIEDVVPEEPEKPTVKSAKELESELTPVIETEELDKFEKRANTTQEAGKKIQSSVNEQFQKAQKKYNELYAIAKESASFINVRTENIAGVTVPILERLESISTTPTGYQSVINRLLDIFQDIGFSIQRNPETGRFMQAIGNDVGTSLTDLIELGKRVNQLINYESLEPAVANMLKPVVAEIKNTIRNGFRQNAPEALKAWEAAEKLYGETANKFKKPSIRKIRRQQYLEEIPAEATKASSIDDLKQILTPEQYKNLEREILEKMNLATYNEARKLFKELGNKLSPEGRNYASRIVNSKRKPVISSPKQLELSVVNSLSKPQRPDSLINYWKTKNGNQSIRNSLKNNPNKNQIIEYLQKQSMHDIANQFLDSSGKIDFKAFQEALKNESNLNAIRDLGGQDAVDFFKQIGQLKEGMERKFELFEKNLERDQGSIKQQTENVNKQKRFYDKEKEINEKIFSKTTNEKVRRAALEKEQNSKKRYLQVSKELEQTKKNFESQYGGGILKRSAEKKIPAFFFIEKLYNKLGIPGKTILGMFGLHSIGVLKGAALLAVGKLLYQLARKSAIRNSLRKVALKPNRNPTEFFSAFETIDDQLQEKD